MTPRNLLKMIVQLNRSGLDYRNDFALVGIVSDDGRDRMICVGRYFRNRGANDAEIAITVHDDFQKRGIGTFLVRTLAEIASKNGITAFSANVRPENYAMLRIFHKIASDLETELDSNIYRVRFGLAAVGSEQISGEIEQPMGSQRSGNVEKSIS